MLRHFAVPLLDQPLQITGARDRRKTQRFTEELKAETKKAAEALPEGHGTPLGEIPSIEANIKKGNIEELKFVHRIVYGKPGKASTVRKVLKQFKGFDFNNSSELFAKKKSIIVK